MNFVVVKGGFSEPFWSIFDAHLHSKIPLGFKEAFIRYIGGQKKRLSLEKNAYPRTMDFFLYLWTDFISVKCFFDSLYNE